MNYVRKITSTAPVGLFLPNFRGRKCFKRCIDPKTKILPSRITKQWQCQIRCKSEKQTGGTQDKLSLQHVAEQVGKEDTWHGALKPVDFVWSLGTSRRLGMFRAPVLFPRLSRRVANSFLAVAFFVATFKAAAAEPDSSLPVCIQRPSILRAWRLPAHRITVDQAYKPSLALLPNGELLMVAFQSIDLPDKKLHEPTYFWRSKDDGRTWSARIESKDVIGREQWITCVSSGTLFLTSHILPADINNPDKKGTHSYLHRSIDGGHTWQRTKVQLTDESGHHPDTLTSRDILEMPNGSLRMGVSAFGTTTAYLWSSRDGGITWERGNLLTIGDYRGMRYSNIDGFFGEDFHHQMHSGKLLHWFRVGHPSPMWLMSDGTPGVTTIGDNSDRTLLCESDDGGRTWTNLRDFGGYGMMYPRLLRLRDSRVLCTYTQRDLLYPIGLRAIISYDDGVTWDFEYDQIVIEGKTPWGCPSGGGFGNTLELKDGTLISCYSYLAADQKTYVETVRWQLPEKANSASNK